MKNQILSTLFALLSFYMVNGQQIHPGIKISALEIFERDSTVNVSFVADTDGKTVKRNRSLLFMPVLSDGEFSVSLPPVMVSGRGTKISGARHEWASKRDNQHHLYGEYHNGAQIDYSVQVPSQFWMHGANLNIETVVSGCCTSEKLPDAIIKRNIWLREDPATEEPVPVVVPEPTTGELLAKDFDFIVPWSDYDENEPFRIYDNERDSSIIIYFRVAKSEIDQTFMSNDRMIVNLLAAVTAITQSEDSEVKRIVIGGFASPEGNYQFNDRLAFDRAVAVKELIMQRTGVPTENIVLHNGSVDWRGLRLMVERSDIPEKEQIISIIDSYPIWDPVRQVGRHGQLMRMNGGDTYRFLLREYFPYLRNGAFIKVYHDNK